MNSNLRLSAQFKYYTFLSLFYVVLVITAQAVAYRMIMVGPLIEPGGIFIFPAAFVVSDVISEVYGPTLARRTILFSLVAQCFFSVVSFSINKMPYPIWWHQLNAFKEVFGNSWLVFVSNVAAILTGMLINTQLIGKTKVLMKGRLFGLRSFASSCLGELILTTIIVSIALIPAVGFEKGINLVINMFMFKVFYSLIGTFPASFLVVILKKSEKINVFEDASINPINLFKFKKMD